MHDLKQALLGIKVCGIEDHPYPIEHAMESVKDEMILGEYEQLPFEDNEFDFVMGFAAIYMLNLRGVIRSLREIQRVGKGKKLFHYWSLSDRGRKRIVFNVDFIGNNQLACRRMARGI